jgi:hypothetical protein
MPSAYSDGGVQNSGLLGFSTSSNIQYSKEHNVSETVSASNLRFGGWERLLERHRSSDFGYLFYKTQQPPHLRMETEPVSEALCSLEYLTTDEVKNPSNPKCYILQLEAT